MGDMVQVSTAIAWLSCLWFVVQLMYGMQPQSLPNSAEVCCIGLDAQWVTEFPKIRSHKGACRTLLQFQFVEAIYTSQ